MNYFQGITDLPAFIAGTIVIVLLPGPNSLYVLSLSTRLGIRQGYRGALGIVVGDALLMLLSAAGVAAILKASPVLFQYLRWLGAAYLLWLGLGLLRAAGRKINPGNDKPRSAEVKDNQERPFAKAFALSMTNPKAIMFFIAFFTQFVSANSPHPIANFVILGLIVQLCSFSYLSMLILSGHHLSRKLSGYRWLEVLGLTGVGLLFCGFAVKLVMV